MIWKENIRKRKKRKTNKKHEDIENELDEIKEYIEKIKSSKNEKPIFKQIIICKVEMNTFENKELKKERKL